MKIKKIKILILLITSIFIINTSYANDYEITETDLDIASTSAILIDSNSGAVIYSKDADKQMYPASTTKIVTAILTIENGNLNDITTVSKTAISPIPSGYSTAYLVEGEEISIQDLLETLLIHSANDSANVLAEYISGSIDEFVNLMNQKVYELGCKNTHFTNTNGIQNENHYSTSEDLAIIAKYCMNNQIFRKIVSMENCTISATNKSGKRIFQNTNDSILKNSKYYRDDCIGIKTGYTSQAKNCIISACKKDDMELIAVLLYSPTLNDRYSDLEKLFEYGYEKLPLIKTKIEEKEEIQKQNQNTVNKENEITNENLVIANNQNFQSFLNSNYFIPILILFFIALILICISIILLINLKKTARRILNRIFILGDYICNLLNFNNLFQ